MKKILTAAAIIVGAATTAQAADLGARRYTKAPPPPAPIYDWTGFYIGVNAGGSVGRDITRNAINAGATPIIRESSHLSPIGAIGGAQIGYNWQIPSFFNVVVGVEADFQGSGQRDNSTCLATCSPLPAVALRLDQKIDWFGTVRGRVGLATGPVLSYVTAGYAYADTRTAGLLTSAGTTSAFAVDTTKSGYVIGSGVEASLGGNWTAKIEYLYLNLGSVTAPFGTAAVPALTTSEIRDHIFRAGLNYRFGNGGYSEPVANWAGLYLGGTFGSVNARNRSSLTLLGFTEAFNLTPEGYTGGGQIGYNWQAGAWVFGAEADFQGSFAKDNKACMVFCVAAAGGVGIEQKVPYLGTVRGRLGYSIGSTLFYGTAGFAYGETKTRFTESNVPLFGTAEIKNSKGGYVVGAGIESPFNPFNLFGPNWTSKTEYLYVDLGRTTNTFTTAGLTQTFSTKTEEHIYRAGINYHFNAPVVAKY